MIYRFQLLVLCFAILTPACKQQSTSDVEGFAENGRDASMNHVAAFLGDSSGIPGTLRDIPNLYRVLNPQNGIQFTFHGPSGVSNNAASAGWIHASASIMINETARIAGSMVAADKAAWARNEPGGTLFFYITSHGGPGGYTATADGGGLDFSNVASQIYKARGGVPLQRLIVMFDTCYSGSNKVAVLNNSPMDGAGNLAAGGGILGALSGIALMTAETPKGASNIQSNIPVGSIQPSLVAQNQLYAGQTLNSAQQAFSNQKGLYHEVIFLSASRPDETSGDSPAGGVGTISFLSAVNAARHGSSGANLSNLGIDSNSLFGGSLFGLVDSNIPSSSTTPSNLNGQLPTATPTTPVAPPKYGSSIRDVLKAFVAGASGQTPGVCMTAGIGDQNFIDPPGTVPVLDLSKSATTTNAQPECFGGVRNEFFSGFGQ